MLPLLTNDHLGLEGKMVNLSIIDKWTDGRAQIAKPNEVSRFWALFGEHSEFEASTVLTFSDSGDEHNANEQFSLELNNSVVLKKFYERSFCLLDVLFCHRCPKRTMKVEIFQL